AGPRVRGARDPIRARRRRPRARLLLTDRRAGGFRYGSPWGLAYSTLGLSRARDEPVSKSAGWGAVPSFVTDPGEVCCQAEVPVGGTGCWCPRSTPPSMGA